MATRSTMIVALVTLAALAALSLAIGAGALGPASLLRGDLDGEAMRLLLVSRLPRTAAAILAGAGLAVAGLIMQTLTANRFVEPSTVGTTESAALGMIVVTLLAPGWPVFAKMLVASGFALAGTGLFMILIARLRLKSGLLVPLIGLILAGIIGSVAAFLAYRFDLMQSLGAWMTGDFSMTIRGRYELLWLALGLTLLALFAADRFTLAGMGRDLAVGLGLRHGQVVALGLIIVALVAAVTTVTVGAIPFVGLVVPNLVSMTLGDRGRRTVPVVALAGAGLVLSCDIIGRIVRAPYEIPVGTIMGVVGAGIFLALLMRRRTAYG